MKDVDLGRTSTVEFGDHVVIGFDKEFLKLNNGKPLEFHAKINENGKLVLESLCLTKLSNTGSRIDNDT